MSHRILLTGASGYLGGTFLARWANADLPPYERLYALVRTDDQADAVQRYGAEPLMFDVKDESAVRKAVVDNRITIVLWLVDALQGDSQPLFIKALADVKKATKTEVHFLHTSGAKMFSSHVGAPFEKPLVDTDPELYNIQKSQKALEPVKFIQSAVDVNNAVIEHGDACGVRTYIFAPCIVYGKGEGFGNPTSIQTVAVIKAAKGTRRVFSVDDGRPTWPVCHVVDNATLYLEIVRAMLTGKDIGYGKQGYYLASSGSVAWEDLYAAIAAALAKRGVVDDESVTRATDEQQAEMAAALDCPKEMVPLQLGGMCTFTAKHGLDIGWEPQYSPSHILGSAEQEVELVLANLKT